MKKHTDSGVNHPPPPHTTHISHHTTDSRTHHTTGVSGGQQGASHQLGAARRLQPLQLQLMLLLLLAALLPFAVAADAEVDDHQDHQPPRGQDGIQHPEWNYAPGGRGGNSGEWTSDPGALV